MLSVRRLAALHVVLHGPRIILAEFAAGVLAPLGLGVLSLSGRARWHFLFVLYLLPSLNHVPLLVHALRVVRGGSARAEAAEAPSTDGSASGHEAQSSFLLPRLPVVILALLEEARDSRRRPTHG